MERSLQAQSSEFWNDNSSGKQGYYDEEYGQFLEKPRTLGDDPAGSGSETGSIFSDEDMWGAEIGGVSSEKTVDRDVSCTDMLLATVQRI